MTTGSGRVYVVRPGAVFDYVESLREPGADRSAGQLDKGKIKASPRQFRFDSFEEGSRKLLVVRKNSAGNIMGARYVTRTGVIFDAFTGECIEPGDWAILHRSP